MLIASQVHVQYPVEARVVEDLFVNLKTSQEQILGSEGIAGILTT